MRESRDKTRGGGVRYYRYIYKNILLPAIIISELCRNYVGNTPELPGND